MTPTGIVSSNEISSTTGIYEGFKNKIPKISSSDISSNMVSSSTRPTHSNTISNTKFLKHIAAEISSQVSSTSGKSQIRVQLPFFQLPLDFYILNKTAERPSWQLLKEFYNGRYKIPFNCLMTADYQTDLFDSKSNGRQDNNEHMISEEAAHHAGATQNDGQLKNENNLWDCHGINFRIRSYPPLEIGVIDYKVEVLQENFIMTTIAPSSEV